MLFVSAPFTEAKQLTGATTIILTKLALFVTLMSVYADPETLFQ